MAIAIVCLMAMPLLASVPAGTRIPNRAQLTYSVNNNDLTVSSNEVEAVVEAVESFTLTHDQSVTVAAGSRVTLTHVLTNTGNTDSQYTLAAQLAPADAPLGNVRFYADSNHNGQLDTTDAEITASAPLTLLQGDSTTVFVVGDIATQAAGGSTFTVAVRATTQLQSVSATNTDTLTISGSNVQIVKSASVSTAKGGDPVTFTLTATNTGMAAGPVALTVDGSPKSYVLIRDVVPANTTFDRVVDGAGATVLYHLNTDADPNSYVSAQPSDLTTVGAIAFAVPALTNNATYTVKFTVIVHFNAANQITNVGAVDYNDGSQQHRESTVVVVKLPDFTPQIGYYSSDFAKKTTVAHVGSPVYVQGDASACNLDPAKIETQVIRMTSAVSHDDETFSATETGPNTGIFRILPNVLTKNVNDTPVVKGDSIMEIASNDKLTAELQCGGKAVASSVFVDPSGVVFDSLSNAPIAGATVTLIDVDGAANGGQAGQPAKVFQADGVTTAPSTVTTGADGRFQFPVVGASHYRYTVTPPNGYKVPSTVAVAALPAGRSIDPSGSYLGTFAVTADIGTVIIDVPADSIPMSGLFVEKSGSKQYAQLGDFVDFTVKVHNSTGLTLSDVKVSDTMPRGFRYVPRSARVNDSPTAEPTISGASYVFAIGSLDAGATVNLTYRVEIGPGVGEGRVYNTAKATSGATTSNSARAAVIIEGGVFSQRGFIVGNVYTTCSDLSGSKTFGVPGAKVFLEDGTYAITDADGKYSLYGVRAQTHVLKVDGYSLPKGSNLVATNARNAADGNSMFVDMKYGELRRADFALECTESVRAQVEDRIKKQATRRGDDELGAAMKSTVNPTADNSTARHGGNTQASGTVAASGTFANSGSPTAPSGTFVKPNEPETTDAAKTSLESKPTEGPADDFTQIEDAKIGFVNLRDGDVLGIPQINLMVKGPTGSKFKLTVNGTAIPSEKVGEKKQIASKSVEIWKFIGIDFKTGANTVTVSAEDPFGNERSATAKVIVPDQVATIKLALPAKPIEADGYSAAHIKITLLDKSGQQVMYPAEVTLEANAGQWEVKDRDEKRAGVQTLIEGGAATLDLTSPTQPGDVRVRATVNGAVNEQVLSFVPQLRPVTAAGVLDYQVRFEHNPSSAIQPVSGTEGFEESLRQFATTGNSVGFGSRSALYLKGKILGSNLLTMAYDSNRSSGERLFRDIQPDQFYPVYGDSSTRGFDAQSTSKFYLRVDNGKSYLLYGDFQTTEGGDTQRTLTNYSRSMTGVRYHYDSDKAKVSSFASYDTYRQVTQEFPANGTSGPFTFSYQNGVENSEKVEVLTRDRNQPGVVIATKEMARFEDYEFEPFTGRLLLKAPLPTLDENMNPVYIRVTYEVDQGGQRFWTGGVDGDYAVTKKISVGGMAIADSNPEDTNQLFGVRAKVQTFAGGTLSGEFAQSNHDIGGTGGGYRVQYRQDTKNLKSDIYFGRTDVAFKNQSSLLSEGRGEAGAKFEYRFSKRTKVLGEFLRTEDIRSGGTLTGADAAVEHELGRFRIRVDLRHAQQSMTPAGGQYAQAGAPNIGDTEQTSLGLKMTTKVARLRQTEFSIGYEQDVTDFDKRRIEVGASMPLGSKGKIYARHEFLSSLGDVYSLNSTQARMATVVGVETNYLKKTQIFSEYRQRDELTNRDTEAAIGLRNTWKINDRLGLSGSFEHIHSFGQGAGPTGTGMGSTFAITGGADYMADNTLRVSTKFEMRDSSTTRSYLTSVAVGKQVSKQWTLLSRSVMLHDAGKLASTGERTQARFQGGAAYRGSEQSRWDMLSMFEYRIQDGVGSTLTTRQRLALFSSNVNYQPLQGFSFTGRYATKWVLDGDSTLESKSFNQMISWHLTKDLGNKFDLGLMGSTLANANFATNQQAFGTEIGYRLKQNLWISSGYNLVGFNERDMPGGSDSRQGAFVRLRFKFDENILKVRVPRQLTGKKDKPTAPAADEGTVEKK